MLNNSYERAAPYEIFMCRAHDNWDNSKPGFHMCYMQNLIRAEEGDTSLRKFVGSYEKQLENVKKYMLKSLIKFKQKKSITDEQQQLFDFLIKKLEVSYSTEDLLDIVKVALQMTNKDK